MRPPVLVGISRAGGSMYAATTALSQCGAGSSCRPTAGTRPEKCTGASAPLLLGSRPNSPQTSRAGRIGRMPNSRPPTSGRRTRFHRQPTRSGNDGGSAADRWRLSSLRKQAPPLFTYGPRKDAIRTVRNADIFAAWSGRRGKAPSANWHTQLGYVRVPAESALRDTAQRPDRG
jgi:hypothetical protein